MVDIPMDHLQQIEQALDRIRPMLKQDGGAVQIINFCESTGVLSVELLGACQGCPFASMTLLYGIEVAVKEVAPYVTKVIECKTS
jgi:Fe-S cluster biogenesis protein NfuA